jgi:hypothetical protein
MQVATKDLATESREFIIQAVERELVGPSALDEIIDESPQQRYVAGQLAPVSERGAEETLDDELSLEERDTVGSGEEPTETIELDSDSSISKARRESLSSVGMSFVVRPGSAIEVAARWGEYTSSSLGVDARFIRSDRGGEHLILFDGPIDLTTYSFGRVELQWVTRAVGSYLIASVFLVNVTKEPQKDGTDRVYQVSLALRGVNGTRPFLSRDRVVQSARRTAEDLLYRDRREYGIGLHSAVCEDDVDVAVGAAGALRMSIVPRVETYVTTSRDFGDSQALSMPFLSRVSTGLELAAELTAAFDGYRSWVTLLTQQIPSLEAELQTLARAQLVIIQSRLVRLDRGIQILKTDEKVFRAFRFANEAMARARFRQDHPRSHLEVPWTEAMSGAWKPFQLAFLVSQLPEAVDDQDENRDVVDVLFFPTGGGKTEAYLGLAAFTLAWRRLSGLPYGGAGTSVLMRYTLRLLTAQQFARAAALISAAECMRTNGWGAGELGLAAFSIGLWVGPMTPSTYENALESLSEARRVHDRCVRDCDLSHQEKEISKRQSSEDSDANFMVLTECPWCATSLCIECVRDLKAPNRVEIQCGNAACPLSETGVVGRIPVWFVDSDVYRECPSMLIGTVDKFATLPYRGEAKSLFGNVRGFCASCGFFTDMVAHKKKCYSEFSEAGRTRAFDLVIQDELHTITDNIGSVYGLYETAIEFLTVRAGSKAKYVCASATVKDVQRQIEQLYGGRPSAVFPPVGLDAGDTFFSRDVPPTAERPGRTYVGIYAPTKSRLTTFVATLSIILASAWESAEKYGMVRGDPYLTLLAYFNTIRDLGAVKSLLADDVPPVLQRISRENGWDSRVLHNWEDELTGRIDSGEVPRRLAFLSQPFQLAPDGGCDFMACTNMISVGVDVPRLGLMVVDGQPKSTAEYIQATSRVGRASPGIVFVVFNSMRPRDVSHYEHFRSYHQSYYRFVEGGSVTPFSDGCVSRYLAGAYIAGYRLSDEQSDNNSADRFKVDSSGASGELSTFFAERAQRFGDHEEESVIAAADRITTSWATSEQPLKYRRPSPPPGVKVVLKDDGRRPVLVAPENKIDELVRPEENRALFTAPRSMRNVEATVPLRVTSNGG